ncbi:MAG: PaeR7I family type II restriction endonuclease [Candidatus Aegiribacteria sp.]|nr:PaeR7I family type II restriction endonuclease [Candidatus Aegiribacteria sp.]
MKYNDGVSRAVQHFWKVRTRQFNDQGTSTGKKDAGNRSAVTGGKHLDGFIELFAGILAEAGLPDSAIFTKSTTLPGYFRPTKKWDLVVVIDDQFLASIEFKAHVGPSFGNNFNNRVEEALGNAMDLLTAYREGKYKPSQKPWIGWLMLLEDTPNSTSSVRVEEPHFDVFPEFKVTSYAKRYELFCERLVRERLYDGTCLLLSKKDDGLTGKYTEPNPEITFNKFATSLSAHAIAYAKMRAQ